MKTIFAAALFVALISAAACAPPAKRGTEEADTGMSAMENAAPAEAAGAS